VDIILVKKGFVESREKAQELIISGKVKVDGKVVLRPSEKVMPNADIEILENINYVSRGYLKIKFAFQRLNISVKDKVCADIGCSTGGFTQFLLESGAKKVFAVDIGVGVLHQKLRSDPRVILYEGKDAKEIKEDFFPEKVDFAACDVSFTSSIPIFASCIVRRKRRKRDKRRFFPRKGGFCSLRCVFYFIYTYFKGFIFYPRDFVVMQA